MCSFDIVIFANLQLSKEIEITKVHAMSKGSICHLGMIELNLYGTYSDYANKVSTAVLEGKKLHQY